MGFGCWGFRIMGLKGFRFMGFRVYRFWGFKALGFWVLGLLGFMVLGFGFGWTNIFLELHLSGGFCRYDIRTFASSF